MLVAVVLAVLAASSAEAATSPRKFFLFANSNTRGPNVVKSFAYYYVRVASERG